MLRVKMLTKIIMAILFSVYSVGGKSIYSDSICLFWGFAGHAPACVEKMWKTKFSESQFPAFWELNKLMLRSIFINIFSVGKFSPYIWLVLKCN